MSSKIHVNKPLTSKMIIDLLDENPDLEEIECPNSLFIRTSDTYIDALNELGISISVIEQRGRPRIYDDDIKEKINQMINEGVTPKKVASRLNLDVKTVYYLKRKKLKQGPKSKYSDETKQEVMDLRKNGVAVKDISSLLNIPVRTLYYIIQKEKLEKEQ